MCSCGVSQGGHSVLLAILLPVHHLQPEKSDDESEEYQADDAARRL